MEQFTTLAQQIGETVNGCQYLTFTLGTEEYGVDILTVQEIKGFSAITPIPNTPAHIKGVMNLRGTITPVVDLRVKFGLPDAAYNQFTVIIVVTVCEKVMGLVVDAVSDVLTIPTADVQEAPDLGTHVDTRFISGMAKASDKLVVLLNLETMLSDQELATIEKMH